MSLPSLLFLSFVFFPSFMKNIYENLFFFISFVSMRFVFSVLLSTMMKKVLDWVHGYGTHLLLSSLSQGGDGKESSSVFTHSQPINGPIYRWVIVHIVKSKNRIRTKQKMEAQKNLKIYKILIVSYFLNPKTNKRYTQESEI